MAYINKTSLHFISLIKNAGCDLFFFKKEKTNT